MSDNRALFVEEAIIEAVKRLLSGRVNEMLDEMKFPIPPVELGTYRDGSTVVPALALSTCERSEKERIIRLDAYSLTITFGLPETPGNEVCAYAYAYAAAVDRALREDPVLGGVANRAVLTGKKYVPPKHRGTGEGWEIVLSLRITVEGVER
jgi:hypothetical protein